MDSSFITVVSDQTSTTLGKFVLSPSSPLDKVEDQFNLPTKELMTPRRKLSMAFDDENSQSPAISTFCKDNGYGDSLGESLSSLEYSMNSNSSGFSRFSRSHSSPENWNQSSCTHRFPLGELQNSGNGVCKRRTLHAKRTIIPSKKIQDKENVNHSPSSSWDSQPLKMVPPSSSRPSSLPVFSHNTLTHQSGENKSMNFIKQISTPLEKMVIGSPIVSQRSSRPSSSTSIPGSDGYYSEVFECEEMEGIEPDLSDTLTSLIHAPFNDPTPMTNVFSNKDRVVRPTPVYPTSIEGVGPSNYFSSFSGKNLPGNQRRGSLKRSSPHNASNKLHLKKRPPLPFSSNSQDSPPSSEAVHGTFLRSQSCIVSSPQDTSPTPFSSGDEKCYIGDFSKPYVLPLVEGSQNDLKSISLETMQDLLKGKYANVIGRYTIIDCRFPYEYNGGHIKGAKNIWTQEQLLDFLFIEPLEHPREGVQHREVFIFHCEFSSQRGPKMNRFLRETDRKKNGMASFPKLYYPELYILKGGYNAFYPRYPELCEPQGYCCMEDENHVNELKTYKLRSKSWNGDCQLRRRPSAPPSSSSSQKINRFKF